MRHREALAHLPAFADGSLSPTVRRQVASHIESCAACGGWLASYNALAELLSAARGGSPEEEHPESGVLALCAVRPEEEFEPDQADLRAHLEVCRPCRSEIELLASAVKAARPALPFEGVFVRRTAALSGTGRRGVAAAALLVAALVPFLLWLGSESSRDEGVSGSFVPELEEIAAPRELALAGDRLFGIDLQGDNLIESDGSLTITQVKVRDGAVVTVRSGGSVVLGDGFVVGSGTRLSVGGRPGASRAETGASVGEEI